MAAVADFFVFIGKAEPNCLTCRGAAWYKWTDFTMKTNSFIIAALSAVALSSCQVPLMTAVELGDVVAVRKALASGLQPGELNAAASVAYAKGNTVILDELMKSGAIAAPDSVAHKKIEFQTTWRWSDEEYPEGGRTDVSNPFLFSQYWENKGVNHVWEKDSSGEISPLRTFMKPKDIVWADTNVVKITESDTDDFYGYMENNHQLEYNRSGSNTGFVFYNFRHDRVNRSYDNYYYYLLTFETPTSGTFKCIEREVCYSGTEHWSIGRFWLKDAPQEPKKEPKKSSKKKRK